MQENKGFNVSVKSFLGAIAVIAVLMVVTYILTFFIPAGEYARVTNAAGIVSLKAADMAWGALGKASVRAA